MARIYDQQEMQVYIENMEIGDKIVTKSRVVTKTETELFSVMAGDFLPLHLSDEGAKALGWKTQLVAGPVTFAVAIGLLLQSGAISHVVAYMGTDKLRFTAPVYPGDSIKVEAEVLSKKQTKRGNLICTYKWTAMNQNGEAVAEAENT